MSIRTKLARERARAIAGSVNAAQVNGYDLRSLTLGQVDLVELNEAFGAQALACIRDLDLDPDRVAQNLVVLKTAAGNANAVAVALDREQWSEVVGTIAGENTIFIATCGPEEADNLRQRIARVVGDAD